MKKRSVLILVGLASAFLVSPAQAGRLDPTSIPCWVFRGEKLELQQTCIVEGSSWLGGGGRTMLWEDGVKTKIAFGIQGRGERPCQDTSVDGVCGTNYSRHPTTLKRITQKEWDNGVCNSQKVIDCVQLQKHSICWQW